MRMGEFTRENRRARVYLFSDLRECDAPCWLVSLFRTSGTLDEKNSSPREDHNASTSLFPANDVPRALDLWCWGFKGRVNFSPRFTHARDVHPYRGRDSRKIRCPKFYPSYTIRRDWHFLLLFITSILLQVYYIIDRSITSFS